MGVSRGSLHTMSKAGVVAAVVGIAMSVMPAQSASADDAVLDGSYKLYFDEGTADGAPSSLPRMTYWYEFETQCSGGCTATGTQITTDDRSGPHRDFDPPVTLQFINGEWLRSGQYDTICADGSVVRFVWQWTLTPQPDGTLTGSRTSSPSGSCAEFETSFISQPITATRTE